MNVEHRQSMGPTTYLVDAIMDMIRAYIVRGYGASTNELRQLYQNLDEAKDRVASLEDFQSIRMFADEIVRHSEVRPGLRLIQGGRAQ